MTGASSSQCLEYRDCKNPRYLIIQAISPFKTADMAAPKLKQQIILQIGFAITDSGITILDLLCYSCHQNFYTRTFLGIR